MRMLLVALLLVSCTWMARPVLAQDLVVLEETTGIEQFRFRDASAQVRLRVQLNSAGSITNVLPSLTPPTCAVFNGDPLFHTVYLGYESAGQVVESTLPSLAQNQTAVLVFNIHFFAGSGSICQTPICGNSFSFDMSYTYDGSTLPVEASTGNHTTFSGPPFGGYDLLERIGTTGRGTVSCTEISNNLDIPFTFEGVTTDFLNDPLVDVLLGVDYDAFVEDLPQGFISALSSFLVPVGPNHFFELYNTVLQDGLENTSEEVVDIATGRQYNVVSLLGGGGGVLGDRQANCDVEFWNFFDITAFDAQGANLKNVIGNWGGRRVSIDTRSSNVDHRETALFLAYQNNCGARNGFGSSLEGFEFSEVAYLPDNLVEVAVNVPAAWQGVSSTNLGSGYSLTWYYRNENTFGVAPIVTGTAQSTNPTILVPYTFPGEFQIEARITRNVTGAANAVGSVRSPVHQIAYTDAAADRFLNAEVVNSVPQADPYLDPGERFLKTILLLNTSTENLTDVSISLDTATSGLLMTFDSVGATAPFGGVINASSSVDINLIYELIDSKTVCAPTEMTYTVSYTQDGFTSSFQQGFDIDVNCQSVTSLLALDGTWLAQACSGTPACTDPNCTGSQINCVTSNDWFFETATGDWLGTSIDNSAYYQLVSPIFRVGDNATLEMQHQAAFVADEAGGVIEYRDCVNGEDCEDQPWQDLIVPLELANSTTLYSPGNFPQLDAGLDQIISNRPVFDGMSAPQFIDESVPDELFTRSFVQFRLVFQVADDTGFPPPGTWTVSSMNYSYTELLVDNVLELPEPLLIPCPGEVLNFSPGVSGIYEFDFYTNVEDIVLGNPPAESNMTGEWAYPIATSDTTYYVVVHEINTDITRVWPLTALSTQEVPEFEICLAAWLSDPVDPACDLNDDLFNDLLDMVIQRNGDLCVD